MNMLRPQMWLRRANSNGICFLIISHLYALFPGFFVLMSVPLVSTVISLIFDVLIVRFVRKSVFMETNVNEIRPQPSPSIPTDRTKNVRFVNKDLYFLNFLNLVYSWLR